MEVMVWSVPYCNLKIHIDIRKNLPNKKKISFLAQFKVPNTPSPKLVSRTWGSAGPPFWEENEKCGRISSCRELYTSLLDVFKQF